MRRLTVVLIVGLILLLALEGKTRALNEPRTINGITPVVLVSEGVPLAEKELADHLFSALKASLPDMKVLPPRTSRMYGGLESLCPPPTGCLILIVAAARPEGEDAWHGSISLMAYRLGKPSDKEHAPLGSMLQKPQRFSGYPSRDLAGMVKAYIDEVVSGFAAGFRKGEIGK